MYFAPRRADDVDVAEQDAVELDGRDATGCKADDHVAAVGRDSPQRLVEHLATDRIDQHVDSPSERSFTRWPQPSSSCTTSSAPASRSICSAPCGARPR